MKNRKLLFFISFLILLSLLSGCVGVTYSPIPALRDTQSFETRPVNTLADLAYGNNTVPNRIYIVENERYVPYLVLTDDYNGNCLLLRERLLDETMPFNDPDETFPYSSYYENCIIDQYLNDEFYTTLSDYVSSQVVDSSILITTKESLDHYDKRSVFTIQRRVFLLSYSEVNFPIYYSQLNEGTALQYFYNSPDLIAYHENGKPGVWWLRTPRLGENSTVYSIATSGSIGGAGIETIAGITFIGIRPAFCLPNYLPVKDIKLDGKTIIVLSNDDSLG